MAFESYEDEVDLDKHRGTAPAAEVEGDSDLEVDLNAPNDALDIEVVDDRAPDDRGKKNAHQIDSADFSEEEIPLPGDSKDEREEYVQAAQKRIRERTFQYHAERRSREDAERQAQAAIELAKSYMTQIQQLQSSYKDNEKFAVGALQETAQHNIQLISDQLTQAHREADAEAIVKLQRQLSDEQLKLAQLKAYRPAEFRPINPQEDFAAIAPRVPVAPQVDEATLKWASRNPWFNQNADMTNHARAIDAELQARGVNPLTDAKTYFTTVDREMRQRFPNHPWLDAPRASPPPVVTAGAQRSQPRTKGKITLTRSQVEVARHLGITPEAYAKELLKLKKSGGE